MKVLPHPVKLIESLEADIKINFISTLFKLLLILAIGILVFLLTSKSHMPASFDQVQQDPSTSWQNSPPAPY